MFDREYEWSALSRYVADTGAGATLGVVSGRRRQGKSFLLESLCEAAGGFYFAATEATERESLRRLGEEVGAFLRSPHPITYPDWETAIDSLLSLGSEGPTPVVIDEFPYLCRATPALPSIVQRAFGPRRSARHESRTRLLLCGSAVSFMGSLLAGSAPLRGRASLDLTVAPFDYRTAARFWGADDERLAVQLHAVVGGTPAYRREFVRDDAPTGIADFDSWLTRTVLDPASPLFKEARYLLAEEPDLRDRALYYSVLAAIAEGNTTRGRIASYIGRAADTLSHPLTMLEDVGFIVRVPDAFHPARTTFRIAEPVVTFYHAIMRPEWGRLERPGAAATVWADNRSRFRSLVLGPHFEHLARSWVSHHCAATTLGARPTWVRPGVLNEPKTRSSMEIDVVAVRADGEQRKRLLALGEAKWGTELELGHLDRLTTALELAAARGFDAAQARLMLFSGAGFTAPLIERATADDRVELIDLTRLYSGV
ncbi:ATP-binding protein [Natronosporangium hydrolyticum]|uniref:ATP-binding protein n=2 Tax=Natronosporangium hydrolyticum TaxID=2811111 RepID=A0A895YSN3_9ACTN|nr:ATP-binding protein [Natronosporangium hydrolyticum]